MTFLSCMRQLPHSICIFTNNKYIWMILDSTSYWEVISYCLPQLCVFGNDYDTPDGTGIRDYIHVVDLAKGHVLAIEKYATPGVHICNLGTGKGYSVLEIVEAFERVNGVNIPYVIKERRPGDIATCYADPTRAKEQLGWVAQRGIDEMCRDSWNFAKKHIS